MRAGASAARVPPSEPKAQRLVRGPSRLDHFILLSGPASGVAGDRGDDLAGVQRTKRSGVDGTPVSSSGGPRSRTREGSKARDPRARERAADVIATRNARQTLQLLISLKEAPCSLHRRDGSQSVNALFCFARTRHPSSASGEQGKERGAATVTNGAP